MELTELLNAGGIAGLIGNALNSLCSFVFARLRTVENEAAKLSTEQHLLMLLLHLSVGVGLGFIFWLSWGFTAIVGVTWWQRGTLFALMTWTLCCVPLVSTQLLTFRVRAPIAAIIALQWLTTFMFAGLACAWSWGNGR